METGMEKKPMRKNAEKAEQDSGVAEGLGSRELFTLEMHGRSTMTRTSSSLEESFSSRHAPTPPMLRTDGERF